jgi:NAD(P)-dependent dehydrogenase (short-subunit alcohol dehydrogenase family)
MVERRMPGAIVNVSSAGQLVAAPNLTHYCVAKAGVEMLTKQMALELAPHRIRVNAVCPGLIESDLNRKDIANPELRERRLARIPLKEIGTPEDVVGAVVFLLAEAEARLVTGASLFVDGGQTIWGA